MSCVAAVTLSSCTAQVSGGTVTSPPTAERGPALPQSSLQGAADALRRSVSCEDSDELKADLAFWDEMRGFDCFGQPGPVFIRVYAHAESVPQTLEDWNGTFTAERAVVRGGNWYVIGPPAVVEAVRAPVDMPRIATNAGHPQPLTAEQDYLTTCMRFVATESQRYVEQPSKRSASAEQYEALFPGVTTAVHSAVDDLGRASVLHIRNHDRWIAALSPIGPPLARACGRAYRKVGATVQPLEEHR